MTYVSLFAGIGGFDYALNKLGMECVYANEWDKYAAQIYKKRIGSVDTKDIRLVEISEIPSHELLVGGFPCQAFSIAGKRRGFDDTRGTLFFEIARILKDKQPKYFILENVKGLLSHSNGDTFKTIISTLTELGYDLQWQVLNSKNFGVPQNRERVFIVGNLRGEPRPEVFPIIGSSGKAKDLVYAQKADREIARLYDPKGLAPTLHLKTGGWQEPKIANALDANYWKGNSISKDRHTPRTQVFDETSVRRLTPLECERLQGFPDGWTEGISDTQRYKCLGNAVTTNVVYEVAKRLVNSLGTNDNQRTSSED